MSTIINDKHKFIFVHVPKTGGTMIKQILCDKFGCDGWIGGHHSITQIKELQNTLWTRTYAERKDYFTFGCVRNPYTRMQSAYKEIRGAKNYKKSGNFEEFCINPPTQFPHIQTQTHWLFGSNTKVDLILRTEHLDTDFPYVLDKLGFDSDIEIPMIRKGDESLDVTLTDKCKEAIQIRYEDDFINFGYEK